MILLKITLRNCALCSVLLACACRPAKQSADAYTRQSLQRHSDNVQSFYNAWCMVNISALPTRAATLLSIGAGSRPSHRRQIEQKSGWTFRIQISNLKASAGPLKYCSRSLEHYQLQYAYLLNDAKNDLFLKCGQTRIHPSSYVFTTHYSSVPMEELLVSFDFSTARKGEAVSLFYVDRVFLHDTLEYPLNAAAIQWESRSRIRSSQVK
jgi:hypothetical protein